MHIPSLIAHLPPLNWQRVSSCENNSVFVMTHCISAGELNHLPALFTCHLIDEANSESFCEQAGPMAKKVKIVCKDTLPRLISFSLDSSLTSKDGDAVRWKAARSLLA
jgi:hypothetical protein